MNEPIIEHRACLTQPKKDYQEEPTPYDGVAPEHVTNVIDQMYRGPIDLQQIERYLLAFQKMLVDEEYLDTLPQDRCPRCGMPVRHDPSCDLLTRPQP